MNATTLAKYPNFTSAWLAYIDAAVTERAKDERTTKVAQANALLNRSTGTLAYFARLYVELLEKAA